MWTASLAENRIIKTGKSKDFQAHNMEHQLSAYTGCNHGEGLAVLHPTYYRHIYRAGLPKFVSFARNVWGLTDEDAIRYKESSGADMSDDEALALAGIEALADLIQEAGLPTRLRELGFGNEEYEMLPEIAESCFISLDKELSDLEGFYKGGALLLGYEDEKPIATIAIKKINDDMAEAKRLYIDPEYRGKGYARHMLNAMLDKCRELKYKEVRFTTKPEVMSIGYALYKKMGFEELENNEGTVLMRMMLDTLT